MTNTTELAPNKRRATRLVRVGIAVAAACLIGGTAYAETTAVPATAGDTVVRSASVKNLSYEARTRVPILAVALPAGMYVLTVHGDLVNFGPSDFTRCQLEVNGTEVAYVSTIVGDPAALTKAAAIMPIQGQGPAGYLSTFSLAGGVKVGTAGATATLQCWHDNANGAAPYVDRGATLVTHRTDSLKVVTQ